MLICKYKWDNSTVNWLEEDMQAACATALRRIEKHLKDKGLELFTFAADQNGGKRSRKAGAKAKAQGMVSGESDLRIYLAESQLWLVELKRLRKGRISPEQIVRHKKLERLGHPVTVFFIATPMAAVNQVVHGLAKRINYATDELMGIAKGDHLSGKVRV